MESIELKENNKDNSLNEIVKLSLKERKEIVKNKLNQPNITNKDLNDLLNYDNTNEDLIFKYLNSFNQLEYALIQKYICVLSLKNIERLKQKYFSESSYGFRKESFKQYFFNMILFLKEKNKKSLSIICFKISEYSKNSISFNQPIDFSNFEYLYFYFCDILRLQIRGFIGKSFDSYLDKISKFLYDLQELNIYNNVNNYEKEKENFQKFYLMIISIICYDLKNINNIKQTINIFNPLKKNTKKKIIDFSEEEEEENKIKINEFFKKFKEEDLNNNLVHLEDFSNVQEKYFSYTFMTKNNIFFRYEKNILSLLEKLFRSNLIKFTCNSIYRNKENENIKYFFEYDHGIEEFWKKNIIFVPFKLKKSSGFSYKDLFKTFICIYKETHYENDIENILFTLGSTIRILIHECLGHLLMIYLYFRMYPKLKDNDGYNSPRMLDKIRELNIESHPDLSIKLGNVIVNFKEKIGNIVKLKKEINSINLIIKEILKIDEIKESENSKNEENNNNYLKQKKLKKELKNKINKLEEETINKINKKLNEIIPDYYSEKLSQKIINNIEDIWNLFNITKDKEKLLEKTIGNKLIGMLFEDIYNEFVDYTNSLDEKGKIYLQNESGNIIEFLLFNDFSNEMSLKECLFLLNEKIYDYNNLFQFRIMYKNLFRIKDQLIINNIIEESESFKDLVKEYQKIYRENESSRIDFNEKKSFRKDNENSFNEKKEVVICGKYYMHYPGLLISKKIPSPQWDITEEENTNK